MTFERILSHFQVRKRGIGKAQCICPAHADREASLTLTDGNDRALIKCHAGCSTEEVVIAAGLKMSDLFYGDGLAKERWRAYIENREKRKIEAVYNYTSINGEYAYTKVRLEGKKMFFGILSNERFAYGLKGKNKKTFNAVYGSISSIKRAMERKEPVFIPEGEKDVNTLVKKGYAAFSCGGANDWNKNVSELCKDADVIVLADNDDPGKKLASTVVKDLKGVAKSIKIIIPMPEVPKADITDYFEAGHTVEEFENLIRNVDDTEKICADIQQDQKQDTGKKRSVIQKSKDEVAGGPALVFKFLDCNYDEDGNVKSVKQLVHNFEVVMDKDSRFAGKIRLNEFAQQPYLYGSVPWENENNCRAWSSHDDSALFSLIQADYGLKSRQDFADALKNVSMRNKFHPVRELLDFLTWDGKEHIRSLLPEYLGAEDSDYTYQIMRLWMLGAVSRVYKPGSKFDYTIILQGSQGIGKSTFVSIAPWSFIKDECIVKYYPEGHYQKPEQITTTLHDALMIAQYYYECGLYVQFTMSLCIEWLFLFVRDDPRYSPPQQKSWYTKCTEEYPEITAMLESEQRSEIIGTLRRMPQNFLFKGLPDDIKDDYKLMDF